MGKTTARGRRGARHDGDRAGLRVLFRELRSYLPGRRRYIILATSAVLASLAEAASLVFLTLSAASLATKENQSTVLGITFSRPVMIALAGGLLAARLLLMWVNIRTVASMATDCLLESRTRMLEAFVDAAYERQVEQSPQVLQDLLSQRADMVAGSFNLLGSVAVASVNLAVLAGTALVLQPIAVLGLTVLASLMVFALRPVNALVRRMAKESIRVNQELVKRLGDLTTNFRDVTAFGVGRNFVRGMEPIQRETAAVYRKRSVVTGFLPHIYQTVGLGLAVAGLAVAAALGQQKVAVLGAVVLLLLRSVSYAQQLLSAAQAVADRIPGVISVREIIEDYRAHRRRDGGLRPASVDDLVVDDVSFRYREGAMVLKHISLTVHAGEMIGVVGPSGSGKSTLLQILSGLREPSEGCLVAGGRPHTEIDPAWWSQRLALVPQDARLLSATLAQNIDFYRDLDEADVAQATVDAQLGQDLDQLGGLHSELSYQGRSISGGQVQRLAIARALAGKPEVLLLDEPTSALDVGTEQRLQEVLDDLHGKVTMVIVAHRLSTVASCDRVVVLDGGEVVAAGPSAEVLEEFGRTAVSQWELLDSE